MNHNEHSHRHHHHGTESEVKTRVAYDNEIISIKIEDSTGTAPELAVQHEKEMHFIMVSNDLEEYYHLHPEKNQKGIYVVNQPLDDGTYQAFVDIAPEGKAYQVTPNTIQVGTDETVKADLNRKDSWTKEVHGKTVTLKDVEVKADEAVPLVFYMHGEDPVPYLGALGHVVIVDEDAKDYIHVHPASADTTTFNAHFPKAGRYKIWAEFKFEDGVHTYSFIVEAAE